MGEQRVAHGHSTLELWALEHVEWTGGVGAQRQLRARQVAGGPQQRERELLAALDDLVLEQAVVQHREALLTVRRVDEAPRHERGQAELVRATFRVQATLDHRERALRVRRRDRAGQREVRAETMVTRTIVERLLDAQETFAAAQLVGGVHLGGHRLLGARMTRPLVAQRGDRPLVRARHDNPGAHRAALGDLDVHRSGRVDERVDPRRRVVVGVAAVAAVDETVGVGDAYAVDLQRDRAGGGVDRGHQVFVAEHEAVGPHRRTGALALDRAVGAPAEAGHVVRSHDHVAQRRAPLANGDGVARLAEGEELFLGGLEVDLRLARRGIVERELDGAVGEFGALHLADARARELGAAHHLQDPADLLAHHDGADALAASRCDHLRGHGLVGGDVDEMHRPGAGDGQLDDSAARGGGGVDHHRRTGGRVHRLGERDERVLGECLGDVARLLVPDAHRLDHFVVAARA